MVAIPEHIDPLLAKIDRAIEDAQTPYISQNIGFGEIGHECSRYLYLKIHSKEPEIFTAEALRRMEAGKRDEKLMEEQLRSLGGIELHTTDPKRENKQFKLDFLDGRLTGRLDGALIGLPQAPATWHVWENKGCDDKKFDNLIKLKREWDDENKVLLEWNFKYYAQVQMNILGAELERCYMTVCTPGLRRITSLRIKSDILYGKSLVEKARMIINAKEPPPRIGDATWYQCKNCRFYGECHGVK